MSYIGQHYSESISLQDAADFVYLSKSHLSRKFQKVLGIGFSDYLRDLRIDKAVQLLLTTSKSITEIALGCGFSNSNIMNINFKEKFGETPSEYRKNHSDNQEADFEDSTQNLISFMSLLKYAAYEETTMPLGKKQQHPTQIQIDIQHSIGELNLCHKNVISVGWAEAIQSENIRSALRRAVKDIGFEYISFHGMLDDTLDVYHENEYGEPTLNFTYLDMLFDFILTLGIKPWVEFGFTPLKLVENVTNMFGSSCINLPKNLHKWKFLVEGFMEHFIDRYGTEELRTWKYLPSPAIYVSYNVFSMKEYLEYYACTFFAVRKLLPDAYIIACSIDLGFITLDGPDFYVEFLDYCKHHDCVPDEFTAQCFQCDYSEVSRTETEDKISAKGEWQKGEPAKISNDPDILKHELAIFRHILDEHGFADRAISITAWNSTIWQGDLGNDTCFKAACIIKAFLENAGSVNAINYSHLTDNTERRIMNSNIFHGGYGLITYQGQPKAAYYTYTFLNQLENILLNKGDGYIVTCTKDRKQIQILLYHYCHYNEETHITYTLPDIEQRAIDRYYGFVSKGVRGFRLYLTGMAEGFYDKQSYSISREHGSSYDAYMAMGAPKTLSEKQKIYLESVSVPGHQFERMMVDSSGELLLSAVLDEHEVRLITLEKR